jgi:hypothetical protein
MDRTGGYYIYEITSSAEGATITSKPGAAPQGYENQKNISAESAIHFRDTSWISANAELTPPKAFGVVCMAI